MDDHFGSSAEFVLQKVLFELTVGGLPSAVCQSAQRLKALVLQRPERICICRPLFTRPYQLGQMPFSLCQQQLQRFAAILEIWDFVSPHGIMLWGASKMRQGTRSTNARSHSPPYLNGPLPSLGAIDIYNELITRSHFDDEQQTYRITI